MRQLFAALLLALVMLGGFAIVHYVHTEPVPGAIIFWFIGGMMAVIGGLGAWALLFNLYQQEEHRKSDMKGRDDDVR